jgi:dTMP kinase
MRGLFITFEGVEGSGKTTQLQTLRSQLTAAGRDVVETRDPGGTAIGTQIRSVLLDHENRGMAEVAELCLYEASRAQLVREVIRPALAQGRIVLCDRFTDSTVAYQGYGRGLDLNVIARLNAMATDGVSPDLTLLLDLDPEVGLARARRRVCQERASQDRIEQEEMSFHRRVRDGYRALAAAEPGRVAILDASGGISEIADQVCQRVEKLLRPLVPSSGLRASG